MIVRTTKIALEIAATIALLVALAAGVLAWRLSSGPISLNFLTPILQRALAGGEGAASIAIGDTVLAWTGWERNIDLIIHDIHIAGPDGAMLAHIPEAAISVSTRALLRGVVAPTEIVIFRPRLTVIRTQEGVVRFGDDEPPRESEAVGDAAAMLPLVWQELAGPRDPDRSLGYLERVVVLDGLTTIYDIAAGRTWRIPDTDVTFSRGEAGLAADASLKVELEGGRAHFSAAAAFDAASGVAGLRVGFEQVNVEDLGVIDARLARLKVVDMATSGTVDLTIDRGGQLRSLAFVISGENGHLRDASLFAADVPFKRIEIAGGFPGGPTRLVVDRARIDLGGPTIELAGELADLDQRPRLHAKALLRNVPTNDLARLWPIGVAPNPRRWITRNLSDGMVEETRVELVGIARSDDAMTIEPTQVDGTLRFSGVTVNYLTPMPKVRNASGGGTLKSDRVELVVNSGNSGEVRVEEASIALTGLDGTDHRATIEVVTRGPLRDTLQLADSPPLGYLKAIGLAPSQFDGEAVVRLNLKFPLLDRLKVDDIAVAAAANVTSLKMRQAALGQDIESGTLALRINNGGMDAQGEVTLGQVPAQVEYSRNFLATQRIQAQTIARARVDSAQRAALGLDLRPNLDGPIDVALAYTEQRGQRGDIALDLKLAEATLDLPELGWAKAAGVPATGRIELRLADGRLVEVPAFRIAGGGLEVAGRGVFAPDGRTLARVEASQVKAGLTDARGVFTRDGGGIALSVEGRSFNAGPLLKLRSGPGQRERPPLRVAAQLDRLYFAPDRYLDRLRVDGRRRPERWEHIDLSAFTVGADGAAKPATICLTTASDGRQELRATADNGGELLKVLDATPNVIGGRLEITGATDASKPDRPLVGKVVMEEFRLVNAPILARILSVALLTGFLDALSGEGIGFRRLTSDFAFRDPKLELDDAHAYGSAMGITARGTIDTDTDVVDLDGTIVPAYTVNSILGNVPLLGPILVPEKGGGVFAANYKVSGLLSDPKVSVSPLSTLAPGFLRWMFNVFDEGKSPEGSDPLSGRSDSPR